MFSSFSNFGNVDLTFWITFVISAVALIGIVAFTLYCLVAYRRKKHPQPANIHGNVALETTWTVATTIIVMIIFVLGWQGFQEMRSAPKNAFVVKVTAAMWQWSFEYKNGITLDHVLVVPENKPIKLLMKSKDVIHSFYLPAFRVKEDVLKSMTTHLWFQTQKPTMKLEDFQKVHQQSYTNYWDKVDDYDGYYVLCAEYCGNNHSFMRARVVVLSQEDFEQWYNSSPKTKPSKPKIPPKVQAVFNKGGCLACHSLDGSPKIGPTFKGIWGRKSKVKTGNQIREITVDAKYIQRSIEKPQADVVVGLESIQMPKTSLNQKDIQILIEFFKTLK
ncbi:MAG: cytochrome c oxidase subunit II [Planctomycetota bacterium]|nr:MAG: cytochrome c oxidase subunit II [Planctomycetota bacterium]